MVRARRAGAGGGGAWGTAGRGVGGVGGVGLADGAVPVDMRRGRMHAMFHPSPTRCPAAMPVRVSPAPAGVSSPSRPAPALPAVLPAPPHAPPGRVRVAGPEGEGRAPLARRVVAGLALLVVAGHVAANLASPYGVHRDELLYLAMGEHLRLWAMDFPPFVALLAQAVRIFAPDVGVDGTALLRLGPALAHGALVVLAAVLARELGGRRGAQGLAAFAVATAPLFVGAGGLYQPVVFDQLWWTLGFVALARLGRPRARGRPAAADARAAWRDWALLGAAVGLGLLTKFSIAFFAAGAAAGILATPLRRRLATPMPWAAAALALALGAPSVVGQLRLGWPVAGQMAELRASQLARVGPLDFLAGQTVMGPALLVAALGLLFLLGGLPRLAQRLPARWGHPLPAVTTGGRAAGVAALVAVLLLMLGRGKAYYAGPVYPLLVAAGAVALLALWGRAGGGRGVGATAAVVLVAFGLLTAPLALPVLPPPEMARYAAAIGQAPASNTGEPLAIPQDFADMLGWPGMAAATAAAFDALPPAERADAAVIGGNYGEAGALALYGARLGLPEAVSPAGSFWFFGPGDREGRTAVVLADSAAAAPELARLFAEVRPVRAAVPAELRPWVVPEERNAWVFVCHGGRRALVEVWPALAGRN